MGSTVSENVVAGTYNVTLQDGGVPTEPDFALNFNTVILTSAAQIWLYVSPNGQANLNTTGGKHCGSSGGCDYLFAGPFPTANLSLATASYVAGNAAVNYALYFEGLTTGGTIETIAGPIPSLAGASPS